jgi:hypothetical protein
MLERQPYRRTSDEVLFEGYVCRNNIPETEREGAFMDYFSKGQACFRASPLTKRFGWGVHFDTRGKMALYGAETEEYARFLAEPAVKKVKAMRNRRKRL